MPRSKTQAASWDITTVGRTPIGLTTWLLLAGAAVFLTASATPSVFRNMGLTEVTVSLSPVARPAESPLAFDDDIPRSVRNLERQAVPPTEEEILQAPKAFQLRADPSDTAAEVGHVKQGTLVMVMRDEGDWLLVMIPGARKADSPTMGWVREESLR